jgi:hypothetical protein
MISQADDDELDALSFTQPQAGPSVPPPSSSQPPISGRIGQSNAPKSTTFGGVRMETRYTGEPTLDEPVSKTIVRDDGQRGLMVDARFDFYIPEITAGAIST